MCTLLSRAANVVSDHPRKNILHGAASSLRYSRESQRIRALRGLDRTDKALRMILRHWHWHLLISALLVKVIDSQRAVLDIIYNTMTTAWVLTFRDGGGKAGKGHQRCWFVNTEYGSVSEVLETSGQDICVDFRQIKLKKWDIYAHCFGRFPVVDKSTIKT